MQASTASVHEQRTLTAETPSVPSLAGTLATLQGFYYLGTGVWPLVSINTFQKVTGRKTDNWTGRKGDHWLVNTVGVLVAAVGASLLAAAGKRQTSGAIPVVAVGSALGLAAIDVLYVARGVISPIYLADAVAELGLAAGWMVATGQKTPPRIS